MRGIVVALGVSFVAQVPPPSAWPVPWPTAPAAAPPAVPSVPSPAAAGPTITFTRNELTFKPRTGSAKTTLLDKDGEDAWASPDGKTILTAYGHDAGLRNGGKSIRFKTDDILDATFSSDSSRVAFVQAQGPLTVRSVPDGAVIWQRPKGRECGVRFRSNNELYLIGDESDAQLVKVVLGPLGATETPLGPKMRAHQCWATPDGKRFIVDDDIKYVARLVDDTGATSVLASGYWSGVGSPVGDRFCAYWKKERELRCIRPGGQVELLYKGNDKLDPDEVGFFDDTGARLLFAASETKDEITYQMVYYVADFAAKTITALRGVKLPSGGSVRPLSGGHGAVAGSASGVTWWDFDAKTVLTIPGTGLYSVAFAQGMPNALFAARESTGNGAKQGVNLIELPK